MQQYAGIYLLQNHSICFVCPSHKSLGLHKTVPAASGTVSEQQPSSNMAKLERSRYLTTLEEGCCSDIKTCTRGCCYSFMYS